MRLLPLTTHQTVGLLFVLGSVAVSTLPAVAYYHYLMVPTSDWWVINGRLGPLSLLVVPIAMASYTLLMVALKWALTGRRRAGDRTQLWSVRFWCWWLVCCVEHCIPRVKIAEESRKLFCLWFCNTS